MAEPANGFDLLERLQNQNGEKVQNFADMTRFLSFKAREKGIPFNGQFELTPLCNFDCKMCYVHLAPDQMHNRPVLSVDTWKDIMHQAWEAGMVKAALTGGECLVYPGFKELFLYLHSLGCEVCILTNGYLLDDDRISFFQEHMPSRIQITLYGWNDDVYERVTGQRAFSKVYENIRKAKAAGLPLSISITPSACLGEDVLETIRLAKTLCQAVAVNSFLFAPREETGRSGDHENADMELYLRIYKLLNELEGRKGEQIPEEKLPEAGGPSHECEKCGLRCGGGRSGFVVDWKGTLLPCNGLHMISANIAEMGFREAWMQVNRESNLWPRVPECEGCAYEHVCNHCAATILEYGEAGKRPAALCERTRFFVKNGIWQLPDCE